ncbi:MAG: hypothetical protein U1F07_01255 [Rubrivivax sp.]
MRILPAFVLFACAAWAAAAAAGARVIDVAGRAERSGARGSTALALFEALAPRERLLLAAGASATLVFDDSGRQFLLRGPGRWELRGNALATLQGAPPEPLPAVVPALRPQAAPGARLAAGGAAMRVSGAIDLAPWPDATRLLAPPAALRWASAGEGSRYKVTLATADGQALVEALVDSASLALPAPPRTRPGMSCAWSVEVESGPRQGARAYAAFSVADETTQQQWSALRPGADAPLSQWVLYARALETAGFADDARAAWERVRAARPELRMPMAR